MAEILTTKLKNDVTRMFYQDILDNEFYFAISSIATGELTRIDAVNSLYSKNEFRENILFGKRVFPEDVKFMIKYYPWQKDSVYTQYDDKIDIESSNFYSIVGPTNNDSGDYRVYKCLSNNNGAESTAPPNYNPTTTQQIYRMPDGYVWKFMYYLTEQQFEAYNATGYVPLVGTFEINPDPAADANNVITGSEVSDIFVENYIDNAGYPYLESGIVAGPPGNDATILLRSNDLSEIQNYYSGMTIVCNTPTNIAYVYVVDTYTWDSITDRGKVKVIGDPKADGVIINSTFKILPTIKIEGDGTGAIAIPRIVNGSITNIEVLNTGKNYNAITATVIDPGFDFDPDDPKSIDVRAVLRPVISPLGYHNFDLIDEMHCRHILMYSYITETDNNKIGKSNTYSAIGLVKNPIFTPDQETANTASPEVFDNRLQIITNDYTKFVVNTVVTQKDINNNTTFSARVHEIDDTANTVYLCSYMGPYINAANNDISLDYTQSLVNSTGQRIQINTPVANNVIESRYTQRSGTVYFMEDFFPLTREESSREEYKLVLEF
tara:strand:+ start:2661 stop:4310 length:1650 start_codon:yes stop_codon:yes gene_type:complete